jgi:hypothetical protein
MKRAEESKMAWKREWAESGSEWKREWKRVEEMRRWDIEWRRVKWRGKESGQSGRDGIESGRKWRREEASEKESGRELKRVEEMRRE